MAAANGSDLFVFVFFLLQIAGACPIEFFSSCKLQEVVRNCFFSLAVCRKKFFCLFFFLQFAGRNPRLFLLSCNLYC